MTATEAIKIYTDHFGGFPTFLFMGASDESIVAAVENAIKSGREIEPPNQNAIY